MAKFDGLKQLAADWETEFVRNKQLHGDKIQCRKGCSDCCHQIFQITEIEAAYISAGIKSLPEAKRNALRERAREYPAARQKLFAERNTSEAWGSLPPPGARLACPALEDGACQIYDFRPVICRKYGIPLYSPQKPDRIFACELNFKPGEEIDDSQLVQIQTNLYRQATELQSEYNAAGGRRDPKAINVARAILEDFSNFPPE